MAPPEVFALPAQATLAQARALAAELDAAIAAAGAGGLCLDAAMLTDFDTAAVALLLHAQRAAAARALPLWLRAAPPKLHQLAGLYGVQALLPALMPAPA